MLEKSYKDIKICCYAMCADEPEAFIDRWLDSMYPATYITVLVTKLNNSNYDYLQKKQQEERFKDKLIIAEQEIKPWRFDTARNESMKLIPDDTDACICTDIDEVLIDDFWEDFRKCVFEHPDFNRIYYKYAWSHDPTTGEPSWAFWYDKIHAAKHWKWEFPVHETLTCDAPELYNGDYYLDENKIYLHHYPDSTKSRRSYLQLLRLRYQENQEDLYSLFYLARECVFNSLNEEALEYYFKLYLKITGLNSLPDQDMLPGVCLQMGKIFFSMGRKDEAAHWFRLGINADSTNKELYINLARTYAYIGDCAASEQVLQAMNSVNIQPKYTWYFSPLSGADWKIKHIQAINACWKGDFWLARQCFNYIAQAITTEAELKEAIADGVEADAAWLEERCSQIV